MNIAACFSVIGNKGATQHASGTTLNKPAQNLEKKYQKHYLLKKKRSVFWLGNFLEEYLSQYRVDCALEDCLSH